jgi:acyl dehydratase
MGRPRGRYWEELEVGERFITRGRTVTEADIINFAGLSGDWNQLHTDAEFARGTVFGERIAHGMLGLVIASGLMQSLELYNDTLIAFLGLTWRFAAPVRIGDTVHLEQTITKKRETRKPDRGIITITARLINQRGEVVQEGERDIMLMRKTRGSILRSSSTATAKDESESSAK